MLENKGTEVPIKTKKALNPLRLKAFRGAAGRIRTADLILTKNITSVLPGTHSFPSVPASPCTASLSLLAALILCSLVLPDLLEGCWKLCGHKGRPGTISLTPEKSAKQPYLQNSQLSSIFLASRFLLLVLTKPHRKQRRGQKPRRCCVQGWNASVPTCGYTTSPPDWPEWASDHSFSSCAQSRTGSSSVQIS